MAHYEKEFPWHVIPRFGCTFFNGFPGNYSINVNPPCALMNQKVFSSPVYP